MRRVSVVIPTLDRGSVVLDTIRHLRALERAPEQILIADQTSEHEPEVKRELRRLHSAGTIRWLELSPPSIPRAMNIGLQEAENEIVLFLDDDIVPGKEIVAAHLDAFAADEIWASAGQVLQPWQQPEVRIGSAGRIESLRFPFQSTVEQPVSNVMAGNLAVRKTKALAIGGFDENFIGAAYRFETDFAWRILEAGGRIVFSPKASIRHLKLDRGGLRAFGEHRSASNAIHTSGDYYFAELHLAGMEKWQYIATRLRQNLLNRFLLRNPSSLPSKLMGELRGLREGRRLSRRGRKLLR
jgi:GT2 family glycosyltransferase